MYTAYSLLGLLLLLLPPPSLLRWMETIVNSKTSAASAAPVTDECFYFFFAVVFCFLFRCRLEHVDRIGTAPSSILIRVRDTHLHNLIAFCWYISIGWAKHTRVNFILDLMLSPQWSFQDVWFISIILANVWRWFRSKHKNNK